jgi:hypothetical protein
LSYVVNISGHFDTAYNVYSSFFKNNKTHQNAFLKNRGVHPLLLKDQEENVTLFIPVVVGGKAMGYVFSAVTSTAPKITADSFVVLDSQEKISNCDIKLTPKLIKVLKNVETGTPVMGTNGGGHYYSIRSADGFKLQAGDITKLMLLGYLELAGEEALVECLTSTAYAFRSLQSKSVSLSSKIKAISDYMECTDTGTRTNPNNTSTKASTSYGDSENLGHWDRQSIGGQLSYKVYRSAKAVDDTDQVKWRKPPKSSVWPYTLEHHWFEIQESGIVAMNLQLTGLLQCTGNAAQRSTKVATINNAYPMFKNLVGLSNSRNLLQRYFTECLLGKMHWSDIENDIKNCHFGVPYNHYYGGRMDGKFMLVSMCLASGMAPVFDKGVFSKFEPISSKIVPPTGEPIRVSMELFTESAKYIQYVPMLLMYQIGLISPDTLRSCTPIVKQKGDTDKIVEIDVGHGLIVQADRNTAVLASAKKLATMRQQAQKEIADAPEELEEV